MSATADYVFGLIDRAEYCRLQQQSREESMNDEREILKARIRERMLSGKEYQTADLIKEFGRDNWGLIDALAQKLRKAGLISFEKRGRSAIWTATRPATEGDSISQQGKQRS